MDLAPPSTDASPTAPPSADGSEPSPRIVGGVAAWLAGRLDVDALWVRIGFVLLALVGGVGLVVYGAMWLAFVVGADPERRWARIAGGAALVVGLPLLLSGDFDVFDGPWAVLVLLVGLALALWQPRHAGPIDASRPVPIPATPSPVTDTDGASPVTDPRSVRARLPRLPVRPPRPPSILGRLTLGVAVLVGAVGALIDQVNGGRLHPEQWLGAAAVTCGVGLVVGAFAGRARWLILPAVAFAATGFAAGEAARIGVEPSALLGGRSVAIGAGDAGGGRRQEHVVVGSVEVSVDGAPTSPVTVDARAGIGEISVWAASDVTVEVRAAVDHGDVDVEGVERPEGTFTIGPAGTPDVVVDARVGRGHIDVRQYERGPIVGPSIAGRDGREVADGVVLTDGGQVVLAGGEAVLDADDDVLVGTTVSRDRVTVVSTSWGEFQLLPGGLLLTPSGEVLDLPALRATSADGTTPPETTATPTLSSPPVTAPGLPTVTTVPGG